MSSISFSIPSKSELPIRCTAYIPNSDYPPVVLFIHGFKGFKDWGSFPDACQMIADRGFLVLAINLSKNGIGDNPTEFTELDLFAEETLSDDLEDVLTVLVNVKRKSLPANLRYNSKKIALIGHSRGGHTALVAAAEKQPSAVITWSAVANYNKRWSDKMIEDWNTQGFTEMVNGRTGQVMRMNKSIYTDAKKNEQRLMAEYRIGEIEAPVLLIHAYEDESVPLKDALTLYNNCVSPNKEIRIIEQTGHTFGAKHPPESMIPVPFQLALNHSILFLEEHLM